MSVMVPKRVSVVAFALVMAASVVGCASVLDLERVAYEEAEEEGDARSPSSAGSTTLDAGAGGPWPEASSPAPPAPAADASTCGVRGDGKLWCTNRADAPLRAEPKASAAVVNTLRTRESWFLCWGTGEPHAGGNSTWYYTLGDDNPKHGWLPGVMLNTPDAFDADPRAYGLRNCSD